MSRLHAFERKLAAAWPPQVWHEVSVLVAVSGGSDSVALLRAMTALKTGGQGRLWAAHFNHRLRGGESEADEAFVVDLCRRLSIPCDVRRAAAGQMAGDPSRGLESAARTARYDFLQQAAARLGARYVVTAHTADDQAETILHRIIRGTGIAGLAGMARARPLGPAATLIRPLLGFRRVELFEYLDDTGQSYRSDSSNADVRFTRNRIRHHLLPGLARRFNSGVVEAVLRLGSLAGEVQAVVERLVEGLAERSLIEEGPDMARIRMAPLAGEPRYLVRELLVSVWRRLDWPLQAMGFAQWELLAEMISASQDDRLTTPRKQMFPGQVLAETHTEQLVLLRMGGTEAG
jgi:tRNA(Ile)-lysidine synthase